MDESGLENARRASLGIDAPPAGWHEGGSETEGANYRKLLLFRDQGKFTDTFLNSPAGKDFVPMKDLLINLHEKYGDGSKLDFSKKPEAIQ